MTFIIRGLEPALFAPLFDRTDAELATMGIARRVADHEPSYPCRVSLAHAPIGSELLLLPFEHQPARRSPYRASGPIYVRRGATRWDGGAGALPDCLIRARALSLRGYDGDDLIADSAVVPPAETAARLTAMLADERIAYVHVHNAGPGCFSCRVDRPDAGRS